MKDKMETNLNSRVWSACPTPLTVDYEVDSSSVMKMVEHHVKLGVDGLFAAGTCGEGPWLQRGEVRRLTSLLAEATAGRMVVSVQVTDNSAKKVLDNIQDAKSDGADVAIVSEPWFAIGCKGFYENYYLNVLEESPLPVGVYVRKNILPPELYMEIMEHPNFCILKDSSCDEKIKEMAVETLKKRPDVSAMTGNEFDVASYLRAGYTGVVAGGGAVVSGLFKQMVTAAENGDYDLADSIQEKCNKVFHLIYAGEKNQGWLTAFKYTLYKMGVFDTRYSFLDFPFNADSARKIDEFVENMDETFLPSDVNTVLT